jgi:hypothetical protein
MKMETKHTPGPWIVKTYTPNHGCWNHWIQSKHGPSNTDEAEANARLIAAAPELLEALKELVAEHEYRCEKLNAENGITDKWESIIPTTGIIWAREAIAKAEGNEK